jgi:hypothetical protein
MGAIRVSDTIITGVAIGVFPIRPLYCNFPATPWSELLAFFSNSANAIDWLASVWILSTLGLGGATSMMVSSGLYSAQRWRTWYCSLSLSEFPPEQQTSKPTPLLPFNHSIDTDTKVEAPVIYSLWARHLVFGLTIVASMTADRSESS